MTAIPTSAVVAVIGAGTMGAGIAQVAAAAGHPVLLYDVAVGAVAKGIAGVKAGLDRLVERKRMSEAERDGLLARIAPAETLDELAGAALVIEAVIEKLAVKHELLAALEKLVKPDAILASNTSSLSITEIAAHLTHQGRVVGMHFFNPAPVMALVEVISGVQTAPEAAETVFDTAKAWGKAPVYAKSTPGFIANRIARPFYGEALRLLEEGAADVATLDAILKESAGFRMGPFELMDLIGIDVNFLVTKSVWEAFFHDPRFVPSLMQQEMVSAGRHGRKTKWGWYDYRPGATAPAPSEAPTGPKPKTIVLSQNPELAERHGVYDPAAELVAMAREAGIAIAYEETMPDFQPLEDPFTPRGGTQFASAANDEFEFGPTSAKDRYEPFAETVIGLDGCKLRLTRGTTGHEPGWREADDVPAVLYDLALDYRAAPRIAIAVPQGADKTVMLAAAGFFQALGKRVSLVEDVPGLIAMRIVAMLANEAADAVYRGVCSPEAADIATMKGLNYPAGPIAWAKKLGWHRIHDVLRALGQYYGDPRYRVAPPIKRWEHAAEIRDE
ncbi:MAG: 3-hydroxyacyl-CoA dehydrogenase [Rhodospirillaceae bacterium]|nr:3-hydroxyacyl-CoA dehydrogenase [Rhodospirillaceae bacterium]